MNLSPPKQHTKPRSKAVPSLQGTCQKHLMKNRIPPDQLRQGAHCLLLCCSRHWFHHGGSSNQHCWSQGSEQSPWLSHRIRVFKGCWRWVLVTFILQVGWWEWGTFEWETTTQPEVPAILKQDRNWKMLRQHQSRCSTLVVFRVWKSAMLRKHTYIGSHHNTQNFMEAAMHGVKIPEPFAKKNKAKDTLTIK